MIDGIVVATARDANRSMTLHAGKSLAADRARNWKLGDVDVAQAGSWTRGELVFVDTPISTIVERINRYSARRVVVDEEVGRHRLSAVLRAGDPGALISAMVSLGFAASPDGTGREIMVHAK
jgi:transmembrane sensor